MLQGWDDTPPADEPWATGSPGKDAWRTTENVGDADAWRGELHPATEAWRGESAVAEAPAPQETGERARRLDLPGRIWKRKGGERRIRE